MFGLQEVERHRLESETISAMAGKPGVVIQVVWLALRQMPGMLLDLPDPDGFIIELMETTTAPSAH